MKIIGFSAGVVGRDSNVDRIVKEIMDETGYDAESVKLTDVDYSTCKGCVWLCARPQVCMLEDDLLPYYQKVKEAESANLPVYVLKSNTPSQMRQFLNTIYPVESTTGRTDRSGSLTTALGEAQEAVNLVQNGQPEVELSPQSAYIRRLQHLIAERNALLSQSAGQEPQRRVRIYRSGT